MNISITEQRITENTDNLLFKQNDTENLAGANIPFSEFLQGQINQNDLVINAAEKLPDIDFSYDGIFMDFSDAIFFLNLTHEGQFTVQAAPNGGFQNLIQTEIVQNTVIQKNVEVTNQLVNLIEKAQSTQKPVRISFDNDISVVLKIDKNGKISAEFVPGSLEAENYLMNNISSLKQRFDEQNLPYTSLSYRNRDRNNKNKEQNRGES